MAKKKTYRTTLVREDPMCFIPVPFDPKEVFGKVRAPVKVSLAGYSYQITIMSMGGVTAIPLRRSNRESGGLEGNETLRVTLELDEGERTIEAPADLKAALRKISGGWERWQALSYTHQREHVEAIEGAKAEATRARRIEKAVAMIAARKRK